MTKLGFFHAVEMQALCVMVPFIIPEISYEVANLSLKGIF